MISTGFGENVMRKAWLILMALISTNYSAYADTPIAPADSLAPIILNNDRLESVTAGAVSSVTMADAVAMGMTYGRTETTVMTYARARQGNWQTSGEGVSSAQGNGFALTKGSSVSSADTTGVSIGGQASASGEVAQAYTSVVTKAIDTRYAEIAIGHVRSIACCGSDTNTSVQASTFTNQDFSASHIMLKDVNTPRFSYSLGNAVIVSISHP